jgi:N-acyl-phosphatidylethanolamine-hydrolysing phospholipase D
MTIDGLTILSDPVFSKCSINDYLGPKRIRPIPCALEEFINDIDIVVVSHDHFDHLDENVVYKLGNSVTWYIPLGLKGWFLKRNVDNVIELDWWEEKIHQNRPDIKIACVPAMVSITYFKLASDLHVFMHSIGVDLERHLKRIIHFGVVM